LITFGALLLAWQLAARQYNSALLLPTPWQTLKALGFALKDAEILNNLLLTIRRVLAGLGIALTIGLCLGFAMGASRIVYKLVDPVIGPLRQVPIMAWVPLTIVWFGLGDGPTLFLIAMVATFPILLNTMAGVRGVPANYYHAARSMGAGRWLFLPGSRCRRPCRR
jgi:NitT/TauT family transport system permease protein